MDQPGKVANPARGQLNREINISLSSFAPENFVSRDKVVEYLITSLSQIEGAERHRFDGEPTSDSSDARVQPVSA